MRPERAIDSIKSDVEAVTAENQDDFFRIPKIQTRFIRPIAPVCSSIYKASGDGPFLACPGSVTQKPLQDFAGAALRKLGFGEFDAARNFEIGEESAAGDQMLVAAVNCRTLRTSFLFRDSNAASGTAVTAIVSPRALNTSIE